MIGYEQFARAIEFMNEIDGEDSESYERAIAASGMDPEDAAAVILAMTRAAGGTREYARGVLDGLICGTRAARLEAPSHGEPPLRRARRSFRTRPGR